MRVGVLDSGVGAAAVDRRRFAPGPEGVSCAPGSAPLVDHGRAVAALIRATGPPDLELLDAQIFAERLVCAPEVAAAGLDWLVERGAQIVNLSWGLPGHDRALRRACARAIDSGVWLVAATPIRGAAPAPARYPGVVSATGDARCEDHEVSFFGGEPADFGASPAPLAIASGRVRGGSSFACARVSGALARALRAAPDRDPRLSLRERAAHHGPQTRPG